MGRVSPPPWSRVGADNAKETESQVYVKMPAASGARRCGGG